MIESKDDEDTSLTSNHDHYLQDGNSISSQLLIPNMQDTQKMKMGSLSISLTIPSEMVTLILSYLPLHLSPYRSILLLTLSKQIHSSLIPFVYRNIQIYNPTSLIHFSNLLKSNPTISRHVRSLWISPIDLNKDISFFHSLSTNPPPSFSTSGGSNSHQNKNKILNLVRNLLRSFRKLIHLALDGGLLSTQVANQYGSSSQPLTLFSINPRSFLNGFEELVFRRVRVLRLVDTSLVDEEIRQIQKLQALRRFTWTLPKDDGDTTRDARILLRLINLTPKTSSATQNSNADPIQSLNLSTSSSNLVPFTLISEKLKNEHLVGIELRTTPNRRRALGDLIRRIPIDLLENPDSNHKKNGLDLMLDGSSNVLESKLNTKSLSLSKSTISSSSNSTSSSTPLDPISALESCFSNLRLESSKAIINNIHLKASLIPTSLIEDFEDLRNQICPSEPRERDRYGHAGLNLSDYYRNSNNNTNRNLYGDSNYDRSVYDNHNGNEGEEDLGIGGSSELKSSEEIKVEEQPDGSRALKGFRDEWREWIVSGKADLEIG